MFHSQCLPTWNRTARFGCIVEGSGRAGRSRPEKPTLEVAKERAKVMTEVHLATLEVIHDRYFHGERAMVPARAMEEVFDKLRKQNGVESRWIAVNLKPMSITHEPKTEFEKKAARELEKGKAYWEEVEDGVYRRATPVPLTSICVNCHAGFFEIHPRIHCSLVW